MSKGALLEIPGGKAMIGMKASQRKVNGRSTMHRVYSCT